MRFNLLKNKEKSRKRNNFKNTNSNKKSREKSRGRSMVEMLGVLAIIGVLSIGGISGYTIAMRKYRVNEIINTMTKYAFLSYAKFQNNINKDSNFATLVARGSENPNMSYMYACGGFYGYRSCSLSIPDLILPPDLNFIEATNIGIDIHGNTIILFHVGFKEKNSDLCKQVNKALGTYYGSDNNDELCEGVYGNNIQFNNGIIVDTDNNAGVETSYSADYYPDPDNNRSGSSYSAD